ncbi:hypothetical protein PENDEC_c016G06679 [Penicillium decumbens]|uniref:Extracellular membrane protein CFEM domain-containing protein n=1 Tax=Penicillium decumbens TaxID=69771 RepID=A0A1V6P8H7_PENDC|nr:hypothetical protein PENDEC_c016G06679 [Penicillium decumbens]
MRIKLAALLAWGLTSSAIASHNGHEHGNDNLTQLERNRLALEQMPPTCSLPACIGLSGTITCVVSAASSRDTTALQKCLSGGLTEICSCAACIPSIMNFLTALGICVTASGNSTHSLSDNLRPSFTASSPTPGFLTTTITVIPQIPTPHPGA